MEYKRDDMVRIVGNISHHCFSIGEIVKITDLHLNYYGIGQHVYKGNSASCGWFRQQEVVPANANTIRFKQRRIKPSHVTT